MNNLEGARHILEKDAVARIAKAIAAEIKNKGIKPKNKRSGYEKKQLNIGALSDTIAVTVDFGCACVMKRSLDKCDWVSTMKISCYMDDDDPTTIYLHHAG